jgi:hypothetical protein
MKIVKYIIQHNGIPILFCPKIIHSNVVKIGISAGFAIVIYNSELDKFKVRCYGSSESLQLNSNKQDCKIIRMYLNNLLCKMEFDIINELKSFSKIK